MRYNIEDLESQILATLTQAFLDSGALLVDTGTLDAQPLDQLQSGLPVIHVSTHVGQISERTFRDPAMMEGFIHLLPFVLIRYAGRRGTAWSAARRTYKHEVRFRIYVGAKSQFKKREAQIGAYAILRYIFDFLHGKQFDASASAMSSDIPKLLGTQITTAEFNEQTTLSEATGNDEQLVVDMPGIVVYQTDWVVELIA